MDGVRHLLAPVGRRLHIVLVRAGDHRHIGRQAARNGALGSSRSSWASPIAVVAAVIALLSAVMTSASEVLDLASSAAIFFAVASATASFRSFRRRPESRWALVASGPKNRRLEPITPSLSAAASLPSSGPSRPRCPLPPAYPSRRRWCSDRLRRTARSSSPFRHRRRRHRWTGVRLVPDIHRVPPPPHAARPSASAAARQAVVSFLYLDIVSGFSHCWSPNPAWDDIGGQEREPTRTMQGIS